MFPLIIAKLRKWLDIKDMGKVQNLFKSTEIKKLVRNVYGISSTGSV